MSMIISLTSARRLLLDAEVIARAGRQGELHAVAGHSRTPSDAFRTERELLTKLLGDEYRATFDVAAVDLESREMAVVQEVHRLANQVRKEWAQ